MTRPGTSRVLRRLVRRLAGTLAAALVCGAATRATAQGAPAAALTRALDLEGAGKMREAAVAFREAYAAAGTDSDARATAILGLERAFAGLGQVDSLLPVLEPALRARPRDPTLRAIQLRTLRTLGRDDAARAAFDQWRASVPNDAAPYREYARQLLDAGRPAAADTVLRLAQRALRGMGELALETAEMQSALGMWSQAAASWRDALGRLDYAEPAALFALQPAPAAARDTIRAALAAPPLTLRARRVLSQLLVAWRQPSEAWAALSMLAPDDSSIAAWHDFAERAEANEQWSAARDAWTRLASLRGGAPLLLRAAAASLAARDAAGALALLDRARDSASTRTATLLRVEALSRLGRAADAARLVADARGLDAGDRARAAALVADAWVRAGDVAQARAALAAVGEAADDGGATGWLALYAGDLKQARSLLKRTSDAPGTDPAMAMTALALLARTRADSAPTVGDAFLSAARGDSARAAESFEAAAKALPEAAPLLLAASARLRAARRDTVGALAVWQHIVTDFSESPEAPEAELAWARTLLARGDRAQAAERLEHLIVTYPRSALVPIARRELERAK
ncbi:hypothetical protein J421_2978 [Gemmatirosa kalamazoonensis]|uniref:Tetratricopeptide repeat-containing protein n=1 Tax=Gemmatirosa kalamazoonensis TaxID=861299 RepID=W0RJJ7_9BACT|nr:hypothetical protein [Gemmatirosa kalamazoonensis]AHG90515.1 hypothetical protein J421_2978 [Gemmatirosa kalamazoonensis]